MFRTFDYKCNKCTEVFEAMTQVDEKAQCACGSTDLSKLMSAPSFELKGNDWPSKEYRAQADCRRMSKNQSI